MPFESTTALTRSMALGDPAAIEAFYRRYFDLMYREARRCIGADESTSLDLVQESMLKMLRSIRPLSTEQQLRCWTCRLVRSVAIDHVRKSGRRLRREMRWAPSEELESRWQDYEMQQARLVWLEETIDKMDGPSSQLLRWRFVHGWTLRRIAETVGLNIGAVDGRIQRLVRQLREQAKRFDHE